MHTEEETPLSLACPKCKIRHTPQTIILNSTVSWPELNWIYFKCPECVEFTHILVRDKEMATVNYMGAPGPAWEINERVMVPDLFVGMERDCANVWLGNEHYKFKSFETTKN